MSEETVNIAKEDTQKTKNLLNDSTYVIWYGVNHLSHIVIPVGLTMLFSALLVNLIRPSGITDALEEGMSVYMVYKEEADNTWDAFWQALINAFVIVCVMGLMTFLMVILYKYRCTKVLYGLLYLSTFSAIGYTGWFVFYMAVTQYNFSWDLISSIFIFVNLGVVSVICIFGTYAPDMMKKCFLVFISCLVCYLLSFFPDWTTWVLLVAMALYDMCAVLTPCGPLKLLLNLSQDREDDIPGLLYETTLDRSDGPLVVDDEEEEAIAQAVAESTKESDLQHIEEIKDQEAGQPKQTEEITIVENQTTNSTNGETVEGKDDQPQEEEEEIEINRIFERDSVSLGLGDFIFYSLMVSKASLSSSVPFVFVFIIILSGLLITMALLSILEMALPALPFSMILGVTAYALAYFVITNMVNSFALKGIIF